MSEYVKQVGPTQDMDNLRNKELDPTKGGKESCELDKTINMNNCSPRPMKRKK